ncbi:cellulose binding domain-containing protein [Sphaerisporangium perillae]|uniref:cellulose binding domain-containing protein n=1 Tax=Sphaerisporangium perillae TaxID=2935860 RepID=UPI00200DB445|nr:cellulose binding domain-containing protein [Sphaerisporangium perillae]
MRKKLLSMLAMALAASFVAGVKAPPVAAAASDPYTYKNVQIAGGGFVPGIIFNQSQKDLIYARTDIGGAYRWNQSSQTWTPLLDWVGYDNWGLNGVVSLATDSVDPNKVYAAAGMYTNSWDPDNGAILRSSDKGATWQSTALPFKLGGNMPGRGMGERLAIDPNKNSVLYFGAPSGNGLWRSTDSGVTWAKVANFPNAGNYVQSPGDAYLGDNQGVVWVTFDKRTGTSGNATQTIYVGVADKSNTVYRTTNGGTSWERVAGQPTGYIAHKGVLDTTNGYLYIATSDTGGPYDGAKGDVWRYATATGAWTQISPIPSSSADDYFGYSGLTVDRQHPGTLMVATQISWWPDVIFFRSTDSGATWTRVWDFTSYPNRSFRYKMDISAAPWLTFGGNPSPPETTPKLGWMTESLEIDPFNSDRMMYGTGATIYGTTDLTKWDTAGSQFTIKPMVAGLEETAVLDLISPPSGAPLVSGLGDIGGFRHNDLTKVPAMMFTQPNFTSTTSLDYAETNPSVMVRSGNFTDSDRPNDSHVAFSTDGGANWFQGTEPGGVNSGGTVAANADGSRFVWAPGDSGLQVVYSVGYGNSWTQSSGVPANAVIESDRVNKNKFYAFSGGSFYVSTDGGATFAKTAATGLPSSGVHFKALPGTEGDIWLAGGTTGLWHSTNSGASFTKVTAVTEADNVGFGKAAPGKTYQALYLVGTVDGVHGVYRSDDTGATWVRINDAQHQYGNFGEALTGDPRIYGRVYIGTNGRGIIYGDRTGGGTSDTTAPTKPGTPTASAITSTGATLSWTASTDNVGVTGYDVYREAGTTDVKAGTATGTSFALTGLTAGTSYTFYVVARDAAGNSSTASNPVTFSTTSGGSGGGCAATYTVTNSWQGGFQGDVAVKNTGTAAITGWTVKWTFANGQTITQLWNGTLTQTGADVTVKNASYNGNLAAGASTSFGFSGTWTTANTVPATVTCTTG